MLRLNCHLNKFERFRARLIISGLISAALFCAVENSTVTSLTAQDDSSPSEAEPFDRAERAGLNDDSNTVGARNDNSGISFLSLLLRGGWFMLPLIALSVMVVLVTIDRFIAIRRTKVMPETLVERIGALGSFQGGFDPRHAYLITQQNPSPAARVLQTMLQKVGRPISEIETAVGESSQREADRLHANVRWLTLAAAVSPLIGLLGTVWGMIQAFYDTTQLLPSQDKAEALAQGIYVALVTTLVGLLIAIPAAVFAHFFESRITSLFHTIDEFVFSLIPQVERYEGQLRFSATAAPNNDNKQVGQPGQVPPSNAPRQVPPTQVPPTQVPPTQVPPTQVPPTQVPPTQVPLTQVPPTQGASTQRASDTITNGSTGDPTSVRPEQSA